MTIAASDYEYVLRHDLMSFIERCFYELNPQTSFLSSLHIEAIAEKLEACRLRQIRRLIITIPPRHLKSLCGSIALPAWYLGHYPAGQVVCVSYGQDLADKFARDCRSIMTSTWYQRLFRTRLSGRQAVHDFTTTDQGGRLATSVGGVLTGRGADLIVIDDPLKPDDALSESRRDAANNWYDHSLISRLNDKANGCVIIIIMQRLHQDDLVGHVLEQGEWEVLSFPAIAEQDQTFVIESQLGRRLFKRRAGEALHSDRESLATLRDIRQRMGEYHFASQYQQTPTPLGGVMVKREWLKFYQPGEQPARFSRIVQSWDTANKSTELSDYSVCTTWGVMDRYFYLLDVFRQRLNYPELKRKVIEMARRHNAGTIVIEDKASGTQLIQDLQIELYGVTPYEPPAGTDKIMRLHAQTAVFENGFVILPTAAPWLADYVTEITSFPGSKYDDQVDSTTQALAYLRSSADLEIWIRLGRD